MTYQLTAEEAQIVLHTQAIKRHLRAIYRIKGKLDSTEHVMQALARLVLAPQK